MRSILRCRLVFHPASGGAVTPSRAAEVPGNRRFAYIGVPTKQRTPPGQSPRDCVTCSPGWMLDPEDRGGSCGWGVPLAASARLAQPHLAWAREVLSPMEPGAHTPDLER